VRDGCVFCDYEGPSRVLAFKRMLDKGREARFFVIEPIDPVTPGHVLVVPEDHVVDFRHDPWLTARTFGYAAEYADALAEGCNLIVSAGAAATQTVPHLHVHIVPRRAGDGLALPWASGRSG
jgi:histidine triad (HIT) family protein